MKRTITILSMAAILATSAMAAEGKGYVGLGVGGSGYTDSDLVKDVNNITTTELASIITQVNVIQTTGNYLLVLVMNAYLTEVNILDVNVMSAGQARNLINLLKTKLPMTNRSIYEQYDILLTEVGITDVTIVTSEQLKELVFKILKIKDNLNNPVSTLTYYLNTLNISTAVYTDSYELITGYFDIKDPLLNAPKTVQTALNLAGVLTEL